VCRFLETTNLKFVITSPAENVRQALETMKFGLPELDVIIVTVYTVGAF
jgi:hypothetical protein